jgi:two-component system, cell cycle sensor histidine kinase and response regulator CckA
MVESPKYSPGFSSALRRGLIRYGLALSTLVVPALLTIPLLRHPALGPLVSFSYVLAVTVAAWASGFWAGILVGAASTFVLVGMATGGKVFLPPSLDFPAMGVMMLISLLASRVAQARRRVEEVLRSANAQLETRVEQRTRELAQAHESLRITVASIGDGVMATDTEGRITLVNPVAQALTGWTEEEAIGQPLTDVFTIVNETTRDAVESPVAKVLRSGLTAGLANHTILLSRDGFEVPIENSGAPIRAPDGAVTGVVLVFRDVTERRRAEEERELRRKADLRLVHTLGNLHDGFLTADIDWRLNYLNPRAAELLRRSAKELLGKALWEVLPASTGSNAHTELERARRNGVAVNLDLHYEPHGAWFHVRAHPHEEGLAVFLRDVTAQKRLEDQLRQAQKMEAIGRFAGGIAHDFNNLLTVINCYAEMILQELPGDSLLREAASEISAAGRRASELTGGLLTFSRRQILQFAALDLNRVIRDLEKMLRRLLGEDVEMTVALGVGLWEVHGDRGQLEQVIMNLAVNARDAMPHGGTLTIETSNTPLDEHYAAEHLGVQPGDYVLLVVTDTGHGMDAKTQTQIFEPFFTTKVPGKGTGLGLATVYGIVKQTGGSISVYSEPGRGTTFKIYLPRLSAKVPAEQRTVAAPLPCRAGRETILLVEDEESLRKLTSTMLVRQGFRVLTARNGQEALAICRQEKEAIHAVLSDMVMPQMSGQQLAVQIRERYPHMKFVFMSGYTEHAVVNQLMLDSDAVFLSKPFTAVDLASKLHQALGGGEQPGDSEAASSA